MKTKWWRNEFKVGLMVIASIVLLSIMLIKASHWHFGAGGHKVRIHFDYVGGLLEDAPIHMYGVEIGQVTLVELVEDKVEVTVLLDEEMPIREGYQIFIDILGLVGEKYIEIMNGPAGNPVTKDDPLRGISPVSVGHVLMKADEITDETLKTIDFVRGFIDRNEKGIHEGVVELKDFIVEARGMLRKTITNVDVLLTKVDKLTEEVEDDVTRTADSLRTFTEGLNTDRERISSLIGNLTDDLDQLADRAVPAIDESVGNFRDVSRELRTSVKKANQQFDDLNQAMSQLMARLDDLTTSSDQKLQKGLDDFGASATELNEIASKIDGIVTEIESGRGTLGKLIVDESGYQKIDEAITAGKRAVEDVSRVTSSINRKLQFIEAMHSSKEYELSYDRLTSSLQNQFRLSFPRFDPYFYSAGLSVRGDNLAYDLQLGRRFGDFVPWVGSIRSKSSIGLDYQPFSKRLWISLEAVDVAQRQPEWDLDVAFRMFGGWYFLVGARDLAGAKIGLNFGVRAILED